MYVYVLLYYNSIYIPGCVSCKFPDRAQSSAQYNIVCRDGEVVWGEITGPRWLLKANPVFVLYYKMSC